MPITTAQLQPIAVQWQNALNQLNTVIALANVSPSGSTITPSGGSLTDINNAVWTFGTTTGAGGYDIMRNGVDAVGGFGTSLVIDSAHNIWTFTAQNRWFAWNGTGWSPETSGPTT